MGGKLIKVVQSTFLGAKAAVRVIHTIYENFDLKMGLKEGRVVSPWLFSAYVCRAQHEAAVSMFDKGISLNCEG